ncbi:hypothetical protein Entas_1484 [Enterobacter soli]|nr:hypothetical protein Entas_1484 [Enterobacter soli]
MCTYITFPDHISESQQSLKLISLKAVQNNDSIVMMIF